jgi:hypothetical protein
MNNIAKEINGFGNLGRGVQEMRENYWKKKDNEGKNEGGELF